MKVRLIENLEATGISDKFNTSSTNEVIVHYDDGSADSEFINHLQVLIDGKWEYMKIAFQKHDIIPDKFNVSFFEPRNKEERERGWG